MKKSTKALLLSALALPGAGHLLLKRYISATFFIVVGCSAIYISLSHMMEQAYILMEKITNGEIRPDVISMTNFLNQQASNGQFDSVSIASMIFLVIWFVALADVYRVSRNTV